MSTTRCLDLLVRLQCLCLQGKQVVAWWRCAVSFTFHDLFIVRRSMSLSQWRCFMVVVVVVFHGAIPNTGGTGASEYLIDTRGR